ncbi:MAG: hypothetical protein ACREFZ_01350 [Acetobacteraceae bacterium]
MLPRNSITTWRRSARSTAPFKAQALNIPAWKTLIEKAGYQMSDIPKKWDEFFAFFELVQKKLRAKGMRHVYGLGYTLSTTGTDTANLFCQVLMACGGEGIIAPDGKPHLGDPRVREAMAKALGSLTTPYKRGYVPPAAINWNNSHKNNAFHAAR